MSFSVAGLASGLDTTALIDSLMFVERAAIRRFEAAKATENAALTAWTDIEARLSNLDTAVTAIRTGQALGATSAASADESVLRVTSQVGAIPGSYSLRVDSLAAAQQEVSAGLAAGSDLVGAGTATVAGGFTSIGSEVVSHTLTADTYTLSVLSIDTGASTADVTFDGVEQTVAVAGDGSFTVTAGDGGTLSVTGLVGDQLQVGSAAITVITADGTTTVNNVSAAINAAGGPARAQLVDTGDGSAQSFRLVITSAQTGLEQALDIDFSGLSLFSGGLSTLRAAADASITLGGGTLTITRPSNTIGDLFDGLAIDLVGLSAGADVEIVVSADTDSRVEAVSAVVDAVTDVLTQLAGYTTYNVDASVGGPLVGSFTARSVRSEINVAMSTIVPASTLSLFSQIGVSIQSDGTYLLDETKLRDALTSDAVGVEQVLLGDLAVTDDGVLDVISATVDALLADTGRIETAKTGSQGTIDQLDLSIGYQETRLEAVEERFRRQFTALETLIGQLQNQGNFLTSLLGQQAGG